MHRILVLLLAPTLVLTACGDDDEPVGVGDEPAVDADQRYTAAATVLESPDHGPQLCSAVAESYPPQCSGPDIVGWDWDEVDAEEAAGTTWGDYTVVGTWDGERLTLTEPPRPRQPGDEPDDPVDFTSPCDPPPGGWAVVDPGSATEEGQQAALQYARRQEDFAGAWVDQSINPAYGEPIRDEADEMALNDPTQLILNLRFTGDLDRHEDAVRELWGGSLCLSEAEHSLAQLEDIRAEVEAEIREQAELTYSSLDERRGAVELGVFVADPQLQEDLDDRYGPGVVELHGMLRPVP